jgi:hypothetical protein
MSDIETSVTHEDVYWTMEWGDKPDEIVFEKEQALALLLINEVVFLNSYWWKYKKLGKWIQDEKRCEMHVREDATWSEEESKIISLNVNCNDVFAWGCADAEELLYSEIQDLYDHWVKDPNWGAAVWCMKKRNELPQAPVYNMIQKSGIWDLDSMGLGKNEYNEALKELDN